MCVLVGAEDSSVIASISYFQSNVRYDVGGRRLDFLTEVEKCRGPGCVYGSSFFHKQSKMQYQFGEVRRELESII
ncbi:uncharacterized protein N7484_000252 [Penicillium longicatenatum]|uniref:uncharacterized protein n=1 Tax=Penicillium longicatenatum TaxID=1561947 RepID=UPI002548FD73|nr:uncharacterized protein N7484_000252 [Penicillium longicatenatum]KAJ5660880.1 hypothetical protein N7484_000252 [Penicillium longicatenatum]